MELVSNEHVLHSTDLSVEVSESFFWQTENATGNESETKNAVQYLYCSNKMNEL